MAVIKQKPLKPDKKPWKRLTNAINTYCNKDFGYKVLTDPRYVGVVAWILIALEVCLNITIIERVKYTEIDWIAYMQECEGFINGTWDYTQLKGDTGPLVYPAGFVYVYTALYYITSYGQNIYLAQYIFLGVYIGQMILTYRIYAKTKKVPPYALILTTLTSYRIHSIYVLRLFNDPVAVLLFYVSLNLFVNDRWVLGSVFYSLAVSVKMNILLYAPVLLTAYLTNLGFAQTVLHLGICAAVQVVLGAPFLYANFLGYLRGSFDIGRVFEHKWTVNYRFLDRGTFENGYFHVALLALHVLLLLVFYPTFKKYLTSFRVLQMTETQFNLKKAGLSKKKTKTKKSDDKLSKDQQKFLSSYENELKKRGRATEETVEPPAEDNYDINFDSKTQLFVLPFFLANFIGVMCARSLHYQFYTWYFHSLLYLVFSTGYKRPIMFLLLAVIEYCWNCYPSTDFSSYLLHLCHCLILLGIYRTVR